MEVTARDVARAAGVSESTVSRALAGSAAVAPATRDRVRRAALELGYSSRPIRLPRRTGTLGIVVPDIANPYFAALSKSLRSNARARGMKAVIVDTDEDVRQERDAAAALVDTVDGLLLCSPRAEDDVLHELAAQVPVVLTSRNVERIPSVEVDEGYSVSRVIAHLRALGHRRIGYVGGPVISSSEHGRSAGLVEQSAVHDDIEIVRVANVSPTVIGGMGAADEVIATGVSAVIAFNDMVAMGLMNRATQRGVRVPADLSVIGFDDVLLAQTASPQLTTVAMPHHVVGNAAVGLVLEWLDSGQPPHPPTPVRAELVVRESTAVVAR